MAGNRVVQDIDRNLVVPDAAEVNLDEVKQIMSAFYQTLLIREVQRPGGQPERMTSTRFVVMNPAQHTALINTNRHTANLSTSIFSLFRLLHLIVAFPGVMTAGNRTAVEATFQTGAINDQIIAEATPQNAGPEQVPSLYDAYMILIGRLQSVVRFTHEKFRRGHHLEMEWRRHQDMSAELELILTQLHTDDIGRPEALAASREAAAIRDNLIRNFSHFANFKRNDEINYGVRVMGNWQTRNAITMADVSQLYTAGTLGNTCFVFRDNIDWTQIADLKTAINKTNKDIQTIATFRPTEMSLALEKADRVKRRVLLFNQEIIENCENVEADVPLSKLKTLMAEHSFLKDQSNILAMQGIGYTPDALGWTQELTEEHYDLIYTIQCKMEKKERTAEAAERSASLEIMKAAPKISLPDLFGPHQFLNWKTHYDQIAGDIKNPIIMMSIIRSSLKNHEDRQRLSATQDPKEALKIIRQRYAGPVFLQKTVDDLKLRNKAENYKISVSNCLHFLATHDMLKQHGLAHKIDANCRESILTTLFVASQLANFVAKNHEMEQDLRETRAEQQNIPIEEVPDYLEGADFEQKRLDFLINAIKNNIEICRKLESTVKRTPGNNGSNNGNGGNNGSNHGNGGGNNGKQKSPVNFQQNNQKQKSGPPHQTNQAPKNCRLCGIQHRSPKGNPTTSLNYCDSFSKLSLEQKWLKVRELNLCKICLDYFDQKHKEGGCPIKQKFGLKCSTCSGDHNRKLCKNQVQNRNTKPNQNQKGRQNNKKKPKNQNWPNSTNRNNFQGRGTTHIHGQRQNQSVYQQPFIPQPGQSQPVFHQFSSMQGQNQPVFSQPFVPMPGQHQPDYNQPVTPIPAQNQQPPRHNQKNYRNMQIYSILATGTYENTPPAQQAFGAQQISHSSGQTPPIIHCIMPVTDLRVRTTSTKMINCCSMLDTGSSICFGAEEFLVKHNFPILCQWVGSLQTINSVEEMRRPVHLVEVIDIYDRPHQLAVVSMKRIGKRANVEDSLFKQICKDKNVDPCMVYNNSNDISLLIGQENANLLGHSVTKIGNTEINQQNHPNLFVMSSLASDRLFLMGSFGSQNKPPNIRHRTYKHQQLNFGSLNSTSIHHNYGSNQNSMMVTQDGQFIEWQNGNFGNNMRFESVKIPIQTNLNTLNTQYNTGDQQAQIIYKNYSQVSLDKSIRDNLELEKKVTTIIYNSLCADCLRTSRNCARCKELNNPLSIQSELEAKMLLQAMKAVKNPTGPGYRIHVRYLFKTDVTRLYTRNLSNSAPCKLASIKLRDKLEKLNLLDSFSEKFTKYLDNNACTFFNDELQRQYSNLPVAYQRLNYSIKIESKSTSCRVIVDSSTPHPNSPINTYMIRGDTSLLSLLTLVFNFLSHELIVVTDISSAYNTLVTDLQSNSLRRFWWFKNSKDPNSISEGCFQRAHFGDSPAGSYLTLAIKYFLGPRAKMKITKNYFQNCFYVDDAVQSFKDPKDYPAFQEDVENTTGYFNMKIKQYIKSKKLNELLRSENKDQTDECCFGIHWMTEQDLTQPKMRFNLSSKKRAAYQSSNLNNDQIDSALITLRLAARLTYQCFDSTHTFLSPLNITLKHLFAEAFKITNDWSANLELLDPEYCKKFRKLLFTIPTIVRNLLPSRRASIPHNYEPLRLIAVSDGSASAFSAILYLVSFKTGLSCGRLNIPNMESCGRLNIPNMEYPEPRKFDRLVEMNMKSRFKPLSFKLRPKPKAKHTLVCKCQELNASIERDRMLFTMNCSPWNFASDSNTFKIMYHNSKFNQCLCTGKLMGEAKQCQICQRICFGHYTWNNAQCCVCFNHRQSGESNYTGEIRYPTQISCNLCKPVERLKALKADLTPAEHPLTENLTATISKIVFAGHYLSQLTVPLNELSGVALSTKLLRSYLSSVPHVLKAIKECVVLSDSTCSLASLSPEKTHTSVRTKNLVQNVYRICEEISSLKEDLPIRFSHLKGVSNPADLNSKPLANEKILEALNSELLRSGPKEFTNANFPETRNVSLEFLNGRFKYKNIEAQQNQSPVNPDEIHYQRCNICLDCVDFCGNQGTYDAMHSVSCYSCTNPQVTRLSYKHDLLPTENLVGGSNTGILAREDYLRLTRSISHMRILHQAITNVLVFLQCCKTKTKPSQQKNNISSLKQISLFIIYRSSQQFFPSNSKTQNLVENPTTGLREVKLRYSIQNKEFLEIRDNIPIISHSDRRLTWLLIRKAHEHRLPNGLIIHLTNIGTLCNLASGEFGAFIKNSSTMIKNYRRNCYICNKESPRHFTPPLGDSLRLTMLRKGVGPFAAVSLDPIQVSYRSYYNCRRTLTGYYMIFHCILTGAVDFVFLPTITHADVVASVHIFCARHGPVSLLIFDSGTSIDLKPQEVAFGGLTPDDVSCIKLPPKCQHLNSVENSVSRIRRLMKQSEAFQNGTLNLCQLELFFSNLLYMLGELPLHKVRYQNEELLLSSNQILRARFGQDEDDPALTFPLDPANLKKMKGVLMQKLMKVRNAFQEQLKMIFKLSQYYSGKKEKVELRPMNGDICLKLVSDRYQLCLVVKVFDDGRRVEIRYKSRGKICTVITQSRELCLIRRRLGSESSEMLLEHLEGPEDDGENDMDEDDGETQLTHRQKIENEIQVRMSHHSNFKSVSFWKKAVILAGLHIPAISPYPTSTLSLNHYNNADPTSYQRIGDPAFTILAGTKFPPPWWCDTDGLPNLRSINENSPVMRSINENSPVRQDSQASCRYTHRLPRTGWDFFTFTPARKVHFCENQNLLTTFRRFSPQADFHLDTRLVLKKFLNFWEEQKSGRNSESLYRYSQLFLACYILGAACTAVAGESTCTLGVNTNATMIQHFAETAAPTAYVLWRYIAPGLFLICRNYSVLIIVLDYRPLFALHIYPTNIRKLKNNNRNLTLARRENRPACAKQSVRHQVTRRSCLPILLILLLIIVRFDRCRAMAHTGLPAIVTSVPSTVTTNPEVISAVAQLPSAPPSHLTYQAKWRGGRGRTPKRGGNLATRHYAPLRAGFSSQARPVVTANAVIGRPVSLEPRSPRSPSAANTVKNQEDNLFLNGLWQKYGPGGSEENIGETQRVKVRPSVLGSSGGLTAVTSPPPNTSDTARPAVTYAPVGATPDSTTAKLPPKKNTLLRAALTQSASQEIPIPDLESVCQSAAGSDRQIIPIYKLARQARNAALLQDRPEIEITALPRSVSSSAAACHYLSGADRATVHGLRHNSPDQQARQLPAGATGNQSQATVVLRPVPIRAAQPSQPGQPAEPISLFFPPPRHHQPIIPADMVPPAPLLHQPAIPAAVSVPGPPHHPPQPIRFKYNWVPGHYDQAVHFTLARECGVSVSHYCGLISDPLFSSDDYLQNTPKALTDEQIQSGLTILGAEPSSETMAWNPKQGQEVTFGTTGWFKLGRFRFQSNIYMNILQERPTESIWPILRLNLSTQGSGRLVFCPSGDMPGNFCTISRSGRGASTTYVTKDMEINLLMMMSKAGVMEIKNILLRDNCPVTGRLRQQAVERGNCVIIRGEKYSRKCSTKQ